MTPPVPDLPEMTAAELRATREGLGLTADWLARFIDVDRRSVVRWESPDAGRTVPDHVAAAVRYLQSIADRQVASAVAEFRAADGIPTMVLNDGADALIASTPQTWQWPIPAGWPRMIAFRILLQVPTLRIVDPA